ncbi:hypothetical protein CSA_023570, partial [Cucumis sativus]
DQLCESTVPLPWTEFTARLGLHSQTTRLVDSTSWCDRVRAQRGSHPLWRPLPRGLVPGPPLRTLLQTTIRTSDDARFSSWALPGSLAVTRGILSRLTWGRVESVVPLRGRRSEGHAGVRGGDVEAETRPPRLDQPP